MELSDWREAVSELNHQFEEIDESRDKIYEWLADKIKDTFYKYLAVYPKVHFTSDGHIIEIRINGSLISSKHIDPSLFSEIGMRFSINYNFDDNADYCLYLRFYPFEEV